MKITLEKEFNTRGELDKFISSRFGTDQDANIEHELEISNEEAEKLSLSGNSKVFGVRVKIV
jgi:uncharacterized protein YpmS